MAKAKSASQPSTLNHQPTTGDTALPVHSTAAEATDPPQLPGTLDLAELGIDDPGRLDEQERGPEAPSDHAPIEPAAGAVIVLPPLSAEPGSGYCQRHVDARLNQVQARNARRLVDALQREGATVSDRPVRNVADAVKWLLERIA